MFYCSGITISYRRPTPDTSVYVETDVREICDFHESGPIAFPLLPRRAGRRP